MKSHDHPNHELIIITRGSMTVTEPDGSTWTGKTGDIFLYPPGCAHDERSGSDDPVELYFISFNGTGGAGICRVADTGGRIRLLTQWLHEARPETFPGIKALQQGYLETIIGEFVRARSADTETEMVSRVRRFMHLHLTESLDLDDLAESALMSRFHFCREYKRLSGITPMHDLKRIRLEEAKILLISTTLPLKTIAPQTGFVNEYHLAREFKKAYGKPPGKMR